MAAAHENEGMKIIGGSVDANFTSKDSYGARWNKEVADYQEREDGSGSHRIVDSLGESETDDSASSPEWTFSSGFGGDRRLSHLPRIPRLVHSSDNHNLVNVEDRDELILSVSVSGGGVGDLGPQSRSSSDASSSSISTLTAAESQSEETSITGSATNMNNNNDSPTPPKSNKRKNKAIVVKNERHSPQLSSSTTSPPMTPPPSTSQNTGTAGASPPPQPIKQMELMMGSGSRNYSDFMRSLAAKYNQQSTTMTPDYYSRTSPANFAFDTRFLKPAAAAALLNLSCSQIPSSLFGDKEKFMDMSSTSTLLSMVRSASAAAANNLESLKANSSSQSHHNKRPNSPLDLSSRDTPNTPPPVKKSKQRNPLDAMTLKSANAANTSISSPCLSSCSTGCTEEAQTMISWSVDEVCRFVSNIDLCKDYVEVFREHAIDGSSLPLLTEEHLMNGMGMKLGPILKFRSTIARKLGTCVICSHCSHCHNNNVNTNSP
ncbi:polyhomeotic-like protein 1 isoform X3 [Folsomia candida]|uniref:polyhomeotic-like protein 1 isoform X3 n=1 Tax=Folsomia candida TaxID=158441 RepID=UPI001604DF6E|nr:polyhomeotic-like protein 1 isoform X3 [Folsomia candida]